MATLDGQLHAIRTPYRRESWTVTQGEPVVLLGVNDAFALVLVGDRALCVDRKGKVVWSLDGVSTGALDSRTAVSLRDGAVDFRDADSGRALSSIEHGAEPSAQPLVTEGHVFVPRSDGKLDVVGRDGALSSCRIADSALFTPLLARASGRVIVGAGEGVIAAISLPKAEP